MAQSKDDIKYGVAQAKLSEDEMLRMRYKHGTPLEGGKIAESEPVDLFTDARRIAGISSLMPGGSPGRRMMLLEVKEKITRVAQPRLLAVEVM